MNNKILGIGILFVLLAAGTAMAFKGNFGTGLEFNSDAMQEIKTAIENNDFQEWKQLQENQLTEENFNAIRNTMQERNQNREKMTENMKAIQTTIENQDYATWKTLMEENNNPRNTEMLSIITEDNFSLLSEMHSAMQSGDIETAKTIMEELGLENGFGKSGFKEINGANGFKGKGIGMKGNFGDCPFSDTTT